MEPDFIKLWRLKKSAIADTFEKSEKNKQLGKLICGRKAHQIEPSTSPIHNLFDQIVNKRF